MTMLRLCRLLIALLATVLCAPSARADMFQSEAWLDALPEEQRFSLEMSLAMLGYAVHAPGDAFSLELYDGITAYERQAGDTAVDGVLSPEAASDLRAASLMQQIDWGLAVHIDRASGLDFQFPFLLMRSRTDRPGGSRYANAGGTLIIETEQRPGPPSVTPPFPFDEPDPGETIVSADFGDQIFAIYRKADRFTYASTFTGGDAVRSIRVTWDAADFGLGYLIAQSAQPARPPPAGIFESAGWPADTEAVGTFASAPSLPRTLMLSGDIGPRALDEFFAVLAAMPDARQIFLNSTGGAVNYALPIAREIRRLGLATYVAPGHRCYSACSYLFLAGSEREAKGELGMHNGTAQRDAFDRRLDAHVAELLAAWGVDQRAIDVAAATPFDSMHVFAPSELTQYGLNQRAAGGPWTTAELADPAGPGGWAPPEGTNLDDGSFILLFGENGQGRGGFAGQTQWLRTVRAGGVPSLIGRAEFPDTLGVEIEVWREPASEVPSLEVRLTRTGSPAIAILEAIALETGQPEDSQFLRGEPAPRRGANTFPFWVSTAAEDRAANRALIAQRELINVVVTFRDGTAAMTFLDIDAQARQSLAELFAE